MRLLPWYKMLSEIEDDELHVTAVTKSTLNMKISEQR